MATNRPPLANDHRGLRLSARRVLTENGRGFTAIRRGIAEHLEEVAKRYYAGDVAVVDEFLQLYCFGSDERKAIKAAIAGDVK